jgi:hypothetical protein
MTQVGTGSTEPDRPLMPKPARITVRVFIDDLPFGVVEDERATEFEARELAREILAEIESLLRGASYTN